MPYIPHHWQAAARLAPLLPQRRRLQQCCATLESQDVETSHVTETVGPRKGLVHRHCSIVSRLFPFVSITMHAAMFMYFAMFVHLVIIEYLQLDNHEGHPVNPMFSLWGAALGKRYKLGHPCLHVASAGNPCLSNVSRMTIAMC